MEALTSLQKTCLEEIIRIKTNFKKTSDARRTKTYVLTRLDALDLLWAQFVKRDLNIQELKESNLDHDYFKKNFAEEAEKHYEHIKDMLEKKLSEIEEKEAQTLAKKETKPIAETSAPSDLNPDDEENTAEEYAVKFLRVQTESINLIKRAIQQIKAEIDQIHSVFYYQHKLNTIQTYWNKVTMNHTEMVANPNKVYVEYFKNNTYPFLEDLYEEVVILLQEKMGSSQRSEDDVKLPRLVLPVFDGDYQAWTSFRDIFLRLIHNNTRLSNAEKMQYLKTHLRKEASGLLQHLTISEANYKTSWQLLNDRFNNTRKLVSVQLQVLLSQQKLDQESAIGIRKLHDTTKECLHALSNLGVDTSQWAPIIAHIVIQKLDFESHKLYEQNLEKPRELPTYEALFHFLENRFQALESLKDSKKREAAFQPKVVRPNKAFEWSKYKNHHTVTKQTRCQYCQQPHKIYSCQKFTSLTTGQKKQFIHTNKLCVNCLTHKDNEVCHSRFRCNICKQMHHTLLHPGNEKPQQTPTSTTAHISTAKSEKTRNIHPLPTANKQVLLATALIQARTVTGKLELLRALIDPGSQASFISEESAQLLSLPRLRSNAEVSGLGLARAGIVRHKLIIELSPRFPSKFSIQVEALVLPQLTRLLPDKKVMEEHDQNYWNNTILADPTFQTPGPIDVILGADIFSSIICEGIKKYKNGLFGQKTEFGWILSGSVNSNNEEPSTVTSMVSFLDLDKTLKKFWEVENVDQSITEPTEDNNVCEQHFRQTHSRNSDGSYTVRIPFKSNKDQLGDSKKRAVARLLQNEKKFLTNKKLESEYKAFMQEYIQLKHMKPVKSEASRGYYLPHQAVIKEESTTTKLRVVFDASSKTTSGISLNDTMYSGPKLQSDITDIILRWRKHRYVFSADIEKMYRQIKIHEDDQNFLRVLWRPSKNEPIQEYQLTTVTYGTTAAPFLAIRTLHQLAQDEKKTYPRASQIILEDFYVDDLLTGADSLRGAKALQRELIQLLASGGFKLRKWMTNQQSLLEAIPDDVREKKLLEINDGEAIKTLGLRWLPASDYFQFRVNTPNKDSIATKRSVLSDIAKLYDPAGWLSPVIIQAKILMQELWLANLEWDSPLPTDLSNKWNQFKKELTAVASIKIPRWIKYTNNCQTIELHGFCDASEKAYAAVVYTKIVNEQGDTIVTMFTSKTKVAPIKKQTTLPRLELCAAVLLTKLLTRAKNALNIKNLNMFAWTDSKITLAWIQGETKKWASFITNRVAEIRANTNSSEWHHVKSEDNPADCASRGITPLKLKTHSLWWSGPEWLALPENKWPCNNAQNTNEEAVTTIESSTDTISNVTTTTTPDASNNIFTRFSSLTKLIRVLTYCRRFIQACHNRPKRQKGNIQTSELHETLLQCIKVVQKESFPLEIKSIVLGKNIPRNSKLLSLTPFLDKEGVLRLGGRLEHAQIPYSQKHPIILPHTHHFTTLVIRDAHTKTLHGGNQATLSYVRQKYWIINAKSAVKAILYRCVTCCRFRGETGRQLMGNLPTPRVIPSRPFTNSGVDYAGPFYIRVSKGRGTKSYKGYIAIFVCLSTKALHLEAVSDLTAEAFLASYKRFTARRGLCKNMYSDCSTTFIGGKNELDKQFVQAVQKSHQEVAHLLTNQGTQWHFIPPASPHFGGLWEAGVKSTKYHLKRIAGDINWTFEEFTTLLAQIEACLNSRPLCPLSNDPSDLAVLTPGHFLVGEPLLTPPEPNTTEKPISYITRWKLINKLRNDFWNIWSSEYLSRLQQRPKWNRITDNMKEGELILIKDDNLPPARWLLGRIQETHAGTDGLVRVATIKTATNTIKRPITKICRLPFDTEELPEINVAAQTSGEQSTIAAMATVVPDTPTQDKEERSAPTARTAINSKRKRNAVRIYPTNIPVRPPIEVLRHTCLSNKHKKIKTSSLLKPLLLLNCIIGVLSTPLSMSNNNTLPIEITPFEHNPGIYMEHVSNLHMVNNVWNSVVYYDLSTYYQQLNGFEECLGKLAELCNKTTTYRYYCNSILTEVRHKLTEMKHNNLILHKRNGNHLIKQRRRRAPLEIIGTLQNSLFGVLDQNYADYIEEEIKILKENENYLLTLAKNQTSIAEVTANVLKKTTIEIQKQFEVFNNHITSNLETLKAGERKNEIIQSFTAMTTYMNIIMNNYEKTQRELIELVVDAHNGKISPFLLTPLQLRDQIKHIREHIPTTLIIPGETSSEDLLNLYKIITVKSRVTDSMIIFKIQIPLPNEKLFQVFKLYPIPTEHNGEYAYIEPSTEFIATSLHRDIYYPLTQVELTECINTDSLGYLCQQKQPLYTRQAPLSRCEMDLLNHKKPAIATCRIKKTHPSQYWIQLQHPNQWIFVTNEETTINVVCGGQVFIKRLHNSGIIRLNANCNVKHPAMSISAQTTFSNQQRSSFLPLTNLSTLLTETQTSQKMDDQPKALVHLDTKPLDDIQFNNVADRLPDISHHHLHHYTMTYVIVTILLITAMYYILPKICKRRKREDNPPMSFDVEPVTPEPAYRSKTSTHPTSPAPV